LGAAVGRRAYVLWNGGLRRRRNSRIICGTSA
jgi:hypothetical protein